MAEPDQNGLRLAAGPVVWIQQHLGWPGHPLHPTYLPLVLLQIGMGGGMKVGINVWRALNNNRSIHPAWVHLASHPLTEEDLPRSIEPTEGAAAATGAAAAGDIVTVKEEKFVARKPTVEVRTFETDEELADRCMH